MPAFVRSFGRSLKIDQWSAPVSARQIVKTALIALLAVIVVKQLAAMTNLPGLKQVAALL